MNFADILQPEAVIADLRVSGKRQALSRLAACAAPLMGVHDLVLFEAITARERLGSTGFGGGLAIPHGRLPHLDRPMGFFARLETPVDYGALDDVPVDLLFLLASPQDAGADHLKALACISRALRDPFMLEELRGATSAEALYAILTRTDLHSRAA